MIGSVSNFEIESVNVASDLSIILRDLSLYQQEGLDNVKQQVPSVINHARYQAKYWVNYGIRLNNEI